MKRKKLIYNSIIILCLIGGIVWVIAHFVHFGRVEYTDNAQIRQDISPVNARVQGFIEEIRFDDFQHVKKGDTLLIIESTPYLLQLAQAEANYQNALAGKVVTTASISTTDNNLAVSDATIQEAQIRLAQAEKDYNRYQTLCEKRAVTQQQLDNAKADYEAAKARYDMLTRQKKSTSLTKDEQTTRLDQNIANIEMAKAAVDLARLNLSYTVVLAPCDGVTDKKKIQVGQLVQPGMLLLNVVDTHNAWVIANYRESQLKHITEGAEVRITVDALPNAKFTGHVERISNATGASFAMNPSDNATGNFIKVEQRVPVRISLNGTTNDQANNINNLSQLRSGLNVECEVLY